MTPNPLQADIAASLDTLYEPDDIVEIRRLPGGRSTWHRAGAVDEIARVCQASNDAGLNVYFGANPRPAIGAKGDACIAVARCIFADFDGDHLRGATTPDEQVQLALHRIADAGLPPPTLVVHSGGGVHTWWRLTEAMTDIDRWCEVMDSLTVTIGSDPVIKNPERIMRVPGSMNHKRGRRASIVSDGQRCDIDDIACAVWHANTVDAEPPEREADVSEAIGQRSDRPHGNGAGAKIIDAFNDRVPIRDLLTNYGYDVVGSRFRHPGKQGREWNGIIRDDKRGRRVSCHWSTNDALNDMKFGKGRAKVMGIHDAFDVFCLLSHKGNLNDAIKDAARRLGIELPKQKRDGDVLLAVAKSADGDEFERLWFGESTLDAADDRRLLTILAKHTTNPKQISRLLDAARARRAKEAA